MQLDFSKIITLEQKQKVAQENLIADFRNAVDLQVEEVAKSKGYNSAAHCASYISSTFPAWAEEARVFVAWRDSIWLTVFQYLEDVTAGLKEVPETTQEVLNILPTISW